MFGALRDCVVPMKRVRHCDSPQILLDTFEKEITDNFTEVNLQKNGYHLFSLKKPFSLRYYILEIVVNGVKYVRDRPARVF